MVRCVLQSEKYGILFFLLPNNISLYGYTTLCVLVDGHLSFYFLAGMNNASVNICTHIFKCAYVCICLGKHLRMELLGQMVNLCLTS